MNASCIISDGFGPNGIPGQAVPCNNVVGSANAFTGQVEFSQYGYNQIEWAVYLFTALNAVGLVAHLALGIYWKTWWMLPTMAGGAAVELIGWCGRIWTINTTKWDPNNGGLWFSEYSGFLMQIVCLVIAPTFFSAANYVLLNRLIRATSPTFSMITPESFTVFFIVADVFCIIVQGVGGGLAGSANTRTAADNGAYVMTGGVCLQLLITVFFAIFYFEFLYRYTTGRHVTKQYDLTKPFRFLRCGRRRKPAPATHAGTEAQLSKMETDNETTNSISGRYYTPEVSSYRILTASLVLGFAALLIVIRGVYRSVELTDGWRGPIAVNQPLFLGMDALLMILLVLGYVAYHPGLAVGHSKSS